MADHACAWASDEGGRLVQESLRSDDACSSPPVASVAFGPKATSQGGVYGHCVRRAPTGPSAIRRCALDHLCAQAAARAGHLLLRPPSRGPKPGGGGRRPASPTSPSLSATATDPPVRFPVGAFLPGPFRARCACQHITEHAAAFSEKVWLSLLHVHVLTSDKEER